MMLDVERDKDRIVRLMGTVSRPLSFKEITRYLHIGRGGKQALVGLLKDMESEGLVVRIRAKRYGLPARMSLVVGRLSCHPGGYGFLIPQKDGEMDVFISQGNISNAMHRDKVVVRVECYKRGGRREGKVIRILERGNKQVVGRIERSGRFYYIIPEDRRILQDIYLEKGVETKEGDMAVVEIISFPEKGRNPRGKIIEVLGDPQDPDVEVKTVIYKFDLPHTFPDDCLKEAWTTLKVVAEKEIVGRTDLRGLSLVTIDGENARDFDDAVCVEHGGEDYRLWVSIADVSHYVMDNSALDREAYVRGTSVYFPDRVLPMLPVELSNGICSLNPGVERLALTVEMRFDGFGELCDYQFHKSVINSRERLTYSDVSDALQGKSWLRGRYKGLVNDLKHMEELANILMKKRFEEGSIDFDLPEAEIILDIRGKTEDIIRSERNIAHRIIEEFMLAANRAVARHLSKMRLPFLYRVHEEPESIKVEAFKEFISNFGYTMDSRLKYSPRTFQKLLKRLEGKPEERIIKRLMLRSMKQATYSVKNIGHFGLAFKYYTHFTSPIRRYPDLIVHRILKDTLRGGQLTEGKVLNLDKHLPTVADHTSQRERVAMEAERDIVELKKVQFMADRVGEVFEGFIVSVVPFGLFVELEDYLIEGLIHISTLQDDYYHYMEKEHSLVGERKRKRYRIGDMVKVRVEGVDLARREVNFTLFS